MKKMSDREKVIEGLRDVDMFIAGRLGHEKAKNFLRTIDETIALLKEQQQQIWEFQDQVEYLTDKQKEQKFFVDESGKITPLPVVVRCKDCVFGKREKNDSTGMTWIYCGHHRENRPEDWFCASGSHI